MLNISCAEFILYIIHTILGINDKDISLSDGDIEIVLLSEIDHLFK